MSILEIDLNKIKFNIKNIKAKLNQNQKFCLVAKANAYGLGDKAVCKFLSVEVDYFAVSSAEEFLRIKKQTNKPIIILDPIYENITKLAKKSAEFCVANQESFDKIARAASHNKKINFKIHIAINTGMNRFGFCDKKSINSIIDKVKKVQNIFISGVFSHYFEANNDIFTKMQYNKFKEFQTIFDINYKKNRPIFHLCNSQGLISFNAFDMVRIGISAYDLKHNSAVKLKSKIIDFQYLKSGECAGYNQEFIAQKDTKIAIVSIGYADGIFRKIVKHGKVLINGKFCKIVAISMDSIFVDVDEVDCNIYDDVLLIGKDKDNEIFVCDLARWCDTINYEILTHISSRVKRKYIKG